MRPVDDSPVTRDGRALVLAHDHGLEHGPEQFAGVEERLDPREVFEMATHDAVTALAVGKGLAETYYPSYEDDVTLMAKLNGTSDMWRGEPDSAVHTSVEYAVEELGADAVGFTVYPGSNNEVEMVEEFRAVQETAREYGVPVAMWAYARGQGLRNARGPETVAYAARMALELGADFAKVKYPGSQEAMAHAVRSAADAKVLLSGGSKTGDREFLDLVASVMEVGCSGLAVGRNVWQHEHPEAILDKLEPVVFEGAAPDAVLE